MKDTEIRRKHRKGGSREGEEAEKRRKQRKGGSR